MYYYFLTILIRYKILILHLQRSIVYMEFKKIVSFVTLCSACFCSFSVKAQTLELTLDDCLKIALSDNPVIRVADMEITRVDYSRKEALAALLPNVSFGATYNRMLQKQVMYMNMDGLGGGSSDNTDESSFQASASSSRKGIKMGLDNSYSIGFQASVPIIAPQLWATMKLNDSQILETV